mgnify:CR=1 FL=1
MNDGGSSGPLAQTSDSITIRGLFTPGGIVYAAAQQTKIFTNQFDTDLSENVLRIEISPLLIPALDAPTGFTPWRSFQSGQPQPVVVKFDLRTHADDHVVRDWWNATASGQAALKDIVVNARRFPADSPTWTTTLFDCAVIAYSPWANGLGASGSSGETIVEAVTARCDRVEVTPSRADINQTLLDVLQPTGGTAAVTSRSPRWRKMGPISTRPHTGGHLSPSTSSPSSTPAKATSKPWKPSSSRPTRSLHNDHRYQARTHGESDSQ